MQLHHHVPPRFYRQPAHIQMRTHTLMHTSSSAQKWIFFFFFLPRIHRTSRRKGFAMHSMIYLHIQTLSQIYSFTHFFPFISFKPLSRKPFKKTRLRDRALLSLPQTQNFRPDRGIPLMRVHVLVVIFINPVPFQSLCQTSLFHLLFLALWLSHHSPLMPRSPSPAFLSPQPVLSGDGGYQRRQSFCPCRCHSACVSAVW